MVSKECNVRAGVYKVQAFGTLHTSDNLHYMLSLREII